VVPRPAPQKRSLSGHVQRGTELHYGQVALMTLSAWFLPQHARFVDWHFLSLGGFQMLSNVCISKLQNGRWGLVFLLQACTLWVEVKHCQTAS
jgi:hypothetical protein